MLDMLRDLVYVFGLVILVLAFVIVIMVFVYVLLWVANEVNKFIQNCTLKFTIARKAIKKWSDKQKREANLKD